MSKLKVIAGGWRTALPIFALVLLATLFFTAQAEGGSTADGTITVYGQTNGSPPPPATAQYRITGSGSGWSFDSGWRSDFGTAITVPTRKYSSRTFTVSYSTVAGYTTPGSDSVSLKDGQNKSETGNWTLPPGCITVSGSTDSVPGSPTGAQFRVYRSSSYNSGWITLPSDGTGYTLSGLSYSGMSGKTYTITFSSVAGYDTPSDRTLTLSYCCKYKSTNGDYTTAATYSVNAQFSDPSAGTITSANPVTGLTAPADVNFDYTLNPGWTVTGASPGTTGGTVNTDCNNTTNVTRSDERRDG